MEGVREAINAGLRRATGFELRRAGREQPAPAPTSGRGGGRPRPTKNSRRQARPGGAPQKRQQQRSGSDRTDGRSTKTPIEVRARYDEAAVAVMHRVKPRTMTSPEKLFGLVQSVRYVVRHGIPGDIVECGVWRGGSMQAVALTLLEQGETTRRLHLFDTFEGMSAPTELDRRTDGTPAEVLLREHDKDHRVWGVAGIEDVTAGMSETGYPSELVDYHQGMVEHTIPAQAPDRIAVLRLDTDWYESTAHELEHLWDRLSPGGVLIVDDYGDWDGARLATEEFLARTDEPLLLLPLGTGRILLKPLGAPGQD